MDVQLLMKKRSFKLAAVALLSILTLAGCSGSKDIATMKGAKITEEDLFKELKKNPQTSEALTQMIVTKVTDEKYAKDVDEKEIDKQYKEVEEQYGGKKPFEEILKQNKMDAKTFKETIKSGLAYQAMLKSHIEIKEPDLKEAWKEFHPDVKTQIMSFDTKDEADKVLKEINDGGDFTKIAKEKSTDEATKHDGGNVTFNSTMKTTPENVMVPQELKDAAYKLEDGKTSEVITAQNMQTGADTFYIVKMVKNQKKGNDYKPFKDELTEIVENNKLQDPTFVQEVVGKELDEANIKIKDDEFKDILAPYLPQKEEKKDDKKDKKTDDKKEESSTDSSK